MKEKNTKQARRTFFFFVVLVGLLFAASAQAQDDGARWHRTVIVSTLNGGTMEYLIDENTKVRLERPYLVIETEGATLSYELETIGQLRYGRRLITEGITNAPTDQPFTFDNKTLYFNRLPENSLIEVFSLDGKQTTSRRCSGSSQIPLHALFPGAYIVKVNSSTFKIVKR